MKVKVVLIVKSKSNQFINDKCTFLQLHEYKHNTNMIQCRRMKSRNILNKIKQWTSNEVFFLLKSGCTRGNAKWWPRSLNCMAPSGLVFTEYLNSDCQRDYYEIGCTELPRPGPQGHIHTARGHCDILFWRHAVTWTSGLGLNIRNKPHMFTC